MLLEPMVGTPSRAWFQSKESSPVEEVFVEMMVPDAPASFGSRGGEVNRLSSSSGGLDVECDALQANQCPLPELCDEGGTCSACGKLSKCSCVCPCPCGKCKCGCKCDSPKRVLLAHAMTGLLLAGSLTLFLIKTDATGNFCNFDTRRDFVANDGSFVTGRSLDLDHSKHLQFGKMLGSRIRGQHRFSAPQKRMSSFFLS